MSKRTELLEKEAAYEDALKILEETHPAPFLLHLKNKNDENFGYVKYYPAKDQTEIVVGNITISLNLDEAVSLLIALQAIYE
jgi:hypothetical protein